MEKELSLSERIGSLSKGCAVEATPEIPAAKSWMLEPLTGCRAP
jgi:hypothetical protein